MIFQPEGIWLEDDSSAKYIEPDPKPDMNSIPSRGLSCVPRRDRKWKEDGNGCPAASLFGGAGDGDMSAARFKELPSDPQTDAGSELTLCGEEWLVDAAHCGAIHARARIAECDAHPFD